jgi:hypothetical protein
MWPQYIPFLREIHSIVSSSNTSQFSLKNIRFSQILHRLRLPTAVCCGGVRHPLSIWVVIRRPLSELLYDALYLSCYTTPSIRVVIRRSLSELLYDALYLGCYTTPSIWVGIRRRLNCYTTPSELLYDALWVVIRRPLSELLYGAVWIVIRRPQSVLLYDAVYIELLYDAFWVIRRRLSCNTTPSVCTLYSIEWCDDGWMMNSKWFGSGPGSTEILSQTLRGGDWKKTRNISGQTVSRLRLNVRNTSLERYHYITELCMTPCSLA